MLFNRSGFNYFGRHGLSLAALSSAIALSTLAIAPAARACSPPPDARPASLSQRFASVPYILQGTVTAIDGETIALAVNHYYRGQGPETVEISGFNSHSCSDYITETEIGDRYLFFAKDPGTGTWAAVYDGAFGSARRWTDAVAAEVATLMTAATDTQPASELLARLRRQVADWTQQPVETIEIASAEPRIWSDSCLGLYLPNTACLQAQTPGWRVVLAGGGQEWVYRTNDGGQAASGEQPAGHEYNAILENGVEVLPTATRAAVFRKIVSEFGVAADQLRVTLAYPHVWGGCYGIYERPDQVCTAIAIYGWQIVVESETGDRSWTYHTNLNGSEARLNPGLSSVGPPAAVRPVLLPERERAKRLR